MKRSTVIWIITAVSLAVIGAAIAVGSMFALGWDFMKLNTENTESKTFAVEEKFFDISVNVPTQDIVFAFAEDGVCKVVCTEQKSMRYSVEVKDGVLTVNRVDTRKWYDYIGSIAFLSRDASVKIYLPESRYSLLTVKGGTGDIIIPKDIGFDSASIFASTGDIKCSASVSGLLQIKLSTGDIKIVGGVEGGLDLTATTGDITVNNADCKSDIKIALSTGEVRMSDVNCKSLTSAGSTGDMALKNVIAAAGFTLTRSTGDIRFDGCDAGEITVKTSTGDVTGSLLTEKIFFTETSTGEIKTPKCLSGGKCEIKTSTGDIILDVRR